MNITIGSWQNKVYLGADKAVALFSDKAFPLTIHSGVLPAGKATLHFSAIDDDGALQYFTYDLNRQKSPGFPGSQSISPVTSKDVLNIWVFPDHGGKAQNAIFSFP